MGCLPASSLRFLFNSLSSPRFNLLRVAKRCFLLFFTFSFSRLILSLSFLCSSVFEALALSFSFLSERFFLAASFSSHILLSSSVSMANLTRLPATTFSSLRFLFNALSSPCFNLLRVAKRCLSWFSIFSFSRLILSLSFICSSVSEALALSFSILSERFFLVHAKADLAYSRSE